MKINFHTNLDTGPEIWPADLPVVPRVGDKIRSAQIWDGGFQLELEVVSVTWVPILSATTLASAPEGYVPHIYVPHIELHLPRYWQLQSIRDFYEWYAPKIGRRVEAFL